MQIELGRAQPVRGEGCADSFDEAVVAIVGAARRRRRGRSMRRATAAKSCWTRVCEPASVNVVNKAGRKKSTNRGQVHRDGIARGPDARRTPRRRVDRVGRARLGGIGATTCPLPPPCRRRSRSATRRRLAWSPSTGEAGEACGCTHSKSYPARNFRSTRTSSRSRAPTEAREVRCRARNSSARNYSQFSAKCIDRSTRLTRRSHLPSRVRASSRSR